MARVQDLFITAQWAGNGVMKPRHSGQNKGGILTFQYDITVTKWTGYMRKVNNGQWAE